jgi:hypothetical protein
LTEYDSDDGKWYAGCYRRNYSDQKCDQVSFRGVPSQKQARVAREFLDELHDRMEGLTMFRIAMKCM